MRVCCVCVWVCIRKQPTRRRFMLRGAVTVDMCVCESERGREREHARARVR